MPTRLPLPGTFITSRGKKIQSGREGPARCQSLLVPSGSLEAIHLEGQGGQENVVVWAMESWFKQDGPDES